jgi:hypothetical protein
MKKITFQIITIAFVFCLTGFAQASLIDDLVDIEHHFPLFGTVDAASGGGQDITVTSGTEVLGMHFGVYDVNVEAESVIVDFLKTNRFGDPGVFDYSGLVLSDLDFQPEYMMILQVSIGRVCPWTAVQTSPLFLTLDPTRFRYLQPCFFLLAESRDLP